MADLLFARPPLVEVICEIRWELRTITTMPDTLIDPHYDSFNDDITMLAKAKGFGFVEELQSPDFPREFRPYIPERRFRKQQGEWPLFQIGPGLFTVNVTPPYGGWNNFKLFLAESIELLFKSYPISVKYLKIKGLELRYLNAFDKKFGYTSYLQFAPEHLNLKTAVPSSILDEHVADLNDVDVTNFIVFPIKSLTNSNAVIRLTKGIVGGSSALLAELLVRRQDKAAAVMPSHHVEVWFENAHTVVRDLFLKLANPELIAKMSSNKGGEI
ncbi:MULTISPECIES: TIGR04255 family protein [Rhodomicrobium]|uniref:TIGR04255 family protein n=1 Tax=Rhodomicrobium TaxID=1068 RepID=UPI000B4BC208|nr:MULTISPECIES: TIGR04255 family protein [Rhodomicrobium]